MASTRHAAKIFISAEASDLCPREHELGTFGTPRLAAFVDGHLRGQSEGQPSFPRPRWQPFSVTVELTSELLLVVLESDPLQPRPGAPFCYGFLRLREELGPLAWQQKIHISRPLEEAPGRPLAYLSTVVSKPASCVWCEIPGRESLEKALRT
eukprot:g17813.t1